MNDATEMCAAWIVRFPGVNRPPIVYDKEGPAAWWDREHPDNATAHAAEVHAVAWGATPNTPDETRIRERSVSGGYVVRAPRVGGGGVYRETFAADERDEAVALRRSLENDPEWFAPRMFWSGVIDATDAGEAHE